MKLYIILSLILFCNIAFGLQLRSNMNGEEVKIIIKGSQKGFSTHIIKLYPHTIPQIGSPEFFLDQKSILVNVNYENSNLMTFYNGEDFASGPVRLSINKDENGKITLEKDNFLQKFADITIQQNT